MVGLVGGISAKLLGAIIFVLWVVVDDGIEFYVGVFGVVLDFHVVCNWIMFYVNGWIFRVDLL